MIYRTLFPIQINIEAKAAACENRRRQMFIIYLDILYAAAHRYASGTDDAITRSAVVWANNFQ